MADELLSEKKEAEEMTKCQLNSEVDKSEDKNIEDKEPNMEIQGSEDHQPFLYELNDKLIVFLCLTYDYIMKCPMCQKETKHIIQHISQSQTCKVVDVNSFKKQFKLYKEENRTNEQRRKEQHRQCQEKSLFKKRTEDEEEVKRQQRKWQEKSMLKRRAECNDEVKKQQRQRHEKSMLKKRVEDKDEVKRQQRQRQCANRVAKGVKIMQR